MATIKDLTDLYKEWYNEDMRNSLKDSLSWLFDPPCPYPEEDLEEYDFPEINEYFTKPKKKCECGAEKAGTTHATWCPMWEEMKNG